jgi:hypothetical protein
MQRKYIGPLFLLLLDAEDAELGGAILLEVLGYETDSDRGGLSAPAQPV